ncbi:hypothetical protein ACOME3_001908 [Neoechinorhynchus agilis]
MSHRNSRDRLNNRRSSSRRTDYTGILRMNGLELGDTIGGGSYGKVKLCYVSRDSRGRDLWKGMEQRMACKIIDKSKVPINFVEKFLPRELEILANVRHKNIVKLHKILEIGSRVYILTEFISGSDLLKFVKNTGSLTELNAKNIYGQIVEAIAYLHHNRIVHRDIKCENILINHDTMQVKVIDFGFARYTYDDENDADVDSMTYCGSAAYAAPEVLKGTPYKMQAYDVWSTGIVLFAMLTGSLPFGERNPKQILEKQKQGLYRDERMNRGVLTDSLHLRRLLEGVLEQQPTKRLTIEQVKSHRWLSS